MATSYVVPQALIYQEILAVPTAITEPLRALVMGPNFYLVRYDESSEKQNGYLGSYNPDVDTSYLWPNRPAGSVVDEDYTKLFMDDAWLRYYQNLAGGGSPVYSLCDYTSRIYLPNVVLVTSNGFTRSVDLDDRDVVVGDGVRIWATIGGQEVSQWTKVAGLIADVVDPVVNAAQTDGSNAPTQAGSASYQQTAGTDNCVDLSAADGSGYDGLEDGVVTETYVIEVTQGSTSGDATTARLKVTSASGLDDATNVVPAAFGSPTSIGTRGLTATWINVCPTPSESSASSEEQSSSSSSSAVAAESSSSVSVTDQDDYLVGQMWSITVNQAWTRPTVASGGTYSCDEDTVYILTVSKGGFWADSPQVTVTTSNGVDAGGPYTVANGVALPIGTCGTTVTFAGTGLNLGDVYYITVEAEGEGAIRTIALQDQILPQLRGVLGSSSSSSSGTIGTYCGPDLNLELFIIDDIEVEDCDSLGANTFDQSDTEIEVKAGIQSVHSSWEAGATELDVRRGSLYVEYRSMLMTFDDAVESMDDIDDIIDILGPITPDNPLACGVYYAMLNSQDVEVKYIAVVSDDLAGYMGVLDVLTGLSNVYGLVPLTVDQTIINTVKAHVAAESTAEEGKWRVLWTALQSPSEVVVIDEGSDGEDLKVWVEDDPYTSGTQYTWVTVRSGNGNAITGGAEAGDIMRINYTTDCGEESYDEYTIDAIINEDTWRLVSGPSAAITPPGGMTCEIWHTQSTQERANALAADASAYGSTRVRAVWPGTITDAAGNDISGIYLCSACAGLRSGIVPHRGMTNLEITGFSAVPLTTELFSNAQLNDMAAEGVYIVTQEPDGGAIYARHALTTDMDSVKEREEMFISNVDSMSYVFLNRLAPYIGQSNVTPSAIAVIETQLDSTISYLKSNGYTELLGAQLIDGVVSSIYQHETLLDRVVAVLDLVGPAPMNNIEVHLTI